MHRRKCKACHVWLDDMFCSFFVFESYLFFKTGTLSLEDLPNSLVILHSLFSAITQLDLALDLRVALSATRVACKARSIDPLPVCSR